MVPEEGIEPSWYKVPGDFESPASTSFTTPAHAEKYFDLSLLSRLISIKKNQVDSDIDRYSVFD